MTFRWRGPLTRGSLLIMESIWVYAVAAFLAAAAGEGGNPSLLGALLVVMLSFAVSRGLQQSDFDLGVLKIWGSVLSLLIFYAIMRVDFFNDWRFYDFGWADNVAINTKEALRDHVDAVVGIPVLWAFWLRGLLRGQQHIGFDAVLSSFAIGIALLAPVVLLSPAADTPRLVGIIAVPYVGIGLLAIGLAHAAQADDEVDRSFAPTWIASVGGAVAIIAVFALLFALIDLHAASTFLQDAGLAIGYVVGKTLFYISYPIFFITGLFLQGLRWMWLNLLGAEPIPPEQVTDATPGDPDDAEPGHLPGWVSILIRTVIGVPLAALVLIVLYMVFARIARRPQEGEVKESTYREGRLASDLGDMLGSLLGRLRPNMHVGRDHLEPARRLYFDMMDTAAKRGVERRPPQTPLDVAPNLDQVFRADTPSRITGVFDDARYGGIAPQEEMVRRLREQWSADQSRREP